MMNISIYLEPIHKAEELIVKLLKDEFDIDSSDAHSLYEHEISKHFVKLIDNCFLLAETNYVDKVYRDSYYHYYSSKLGDYKRDCIRISIFEGVILQSDFGDSNKQAKLQDQYRGFIVLRPTFPYIIGRSIISPLVLKNHDFHCCTAVFNTTANAQKFIVRGFPHSSQDTETNSCAETTIWALMEYFGNKYTEYKPVLSSKIIQTLNIVSFERQIPSKGLNIYQMSFALKEFGFGTRIYSRAEYDSEFDSLLSCYIESGIPVIIALQGGTIGHALLAIGHETVEDNMIDAITPYFSTNKQLQDDIIHKNITIYDYHSSVKDFIFIDDNHPGYQRAKLSSPATHYPAEWHNCAITYFIAPLYTKIYLEAYEAKKWILHFLVSGLHPLPNHSEVLLKLFLASSHSFKDEIAKNDTLESDFKDVVLETSMPRFIWVAELSTKELMKQNRTNGVIILDATEANTRFNKPLIIAWYEGALIKFDFSSGKLEKVLFPLSVFTVFQHNLKIL
ncbi:hypothetical protein FACS1894199_14380 [Bacteroidia bacterium]|nr:hypothetical protein FACS1894199_14380 [Bacteroidia bacterium]